MKLVGAIVIILAAYVLGNARRKNMVMGEKVVAQMIHLFLELRSTVEYGAASMVTQLERCAYKETYQDLAFLQGIETLAQCKSLNDALCNAFDSWEHVQKISGEEYQIIRHVFLQVGRDSSAGEIKKYDYAIEQLKHTLDNRRQINEKRKGYYETLFTLVGIGVAIVII